MFHDSIWGGGGGNARCGQSVATRQDPICAREKENHGKEKPKAMEVGGQTHKGVLREIQKKNRTTDIEATGGGKGQKYSVDIKGLLESIQEWG